VAKIPAARRFDLTDGQSAVLERVRPNPVGATGLARPATVSGRAIGTAAGGAHRRPHRSAVGSFVVHCQQCGV
jgi:hypothetical protein